MPHMTPAAVIFCLIFATVFAWAAALKPEKKTITSRLGVSPFSFSFLTGSAAFTLVYILNRMVFPRWPGTTAVFNLAALAGIFAWPVLRKKISGRRLKILKTPRFHPEAEGLKRMLERDPLNAFCFERLSEIFEEQGDHGKALDAAHGAARLDPTVRNKLRVKQLLRDAGRGVPAGKFYYNNNHGNNGPESAVPDKRYRAPQREAVKL